MEFVGQKRLKETFGRYTLDSLPKAQLLIGPEGCGKRFASKILAEKLGLRYIEITKDIDSDLLLSYEQSPVMSLYLIDLEKMILKDQNQFLKFIEEPGPYAFVIAICESEANVLPTIANRCQKTYFERYSAKELSEFSWAAGLSESDIESISCVCDTPGKILNVSVASMSKLTGLCDLILSKISVASFANAMTLMSKVNLKEDYDKVGFEEFFAMMRKRALSKYRETKDSMYFKIYMLTAEFDRDRFDMPVSKEPFMAKYLATLWRATHDKTSRV